MKSKKIKSFFLTAGGLFSIAAIPTMVSCEQKTTPNKSEEIEKQKKDVEKELNDLNIKVALSNENAGPLGNKYPSDLLLSDVKVESSLPQGITYKIKAIKSRNNVNGTAIVEVEFKKNDFIVTKDIVMTGLSIHPFGSDSNLNDLDRYAIPIGIYGKMTQLERFEADNNNYMNNRNLYKFPFDADPNAPLDKSPDANLHGTYKPLTATKEQLDAYDKLAAKTNQDSYANSKRKGFTVPVFDADGKIIGLQPNETAELNKGPNWVDAFSDRTAGRVPVGLARTLPNEFYKKMGLQTFSLGITNKNPKTNKQTQSFFGTTWILDYQMSTNNKYPTKWYFATNTHVAELLKFKNDPNYPTKANDDELTSSISFSRITDRTPVRSTIKTTKREKTIETWSFNPNQLSDAFKTVYLGYNYLKTSPKDYLAPNTKYFDSEEFADFGVFEIDFTKIKPSDVKKSSATEAISQTFTSSEDIAKDLTNAYADKKEDQIKFASTSYLKDYDKINWPVAKNNNDRIHQKNNGQWIYDGLYALGFPISSDDGFLDVYADADQRTDSKYYTSLWINGKGGWYDKLGILETTNQGNFSEEELKAGDALSYSIGYRTFKDKPGIGDVFISSPVIGEHATKYKIQNPGSKTGSKLIDDFDVDSKVSNNFDNTYLTHGLNYVLRHFSPFGGSSGSSIRNQNNEVVAILYVSNQSAKSSLALALRSEGVDYEGAYGKYNLEQYDLIYGGGKNQRTSYRQALQKLYGDNFKTNLFEKGLSTTNIPEKFKFSNTYPKASELKEKL